MDRRITAGLVVAGSRADQSFGPDGLLQGVDPEDRSDEGAAREFMAHLHHDADVNHRRRLMVAICRPLLVATAVGVILIGSGCGDLGQREQSTAERTCTAEMPTAQPAIRGGYFHMKNGAGGRSATLLELGDDRTAEQVFVDTCVAGLLNPD